MPRSSKRAQTMIAAGLFIAGLLLGAPVAIATDSQTEYVVLAEAGRPRPTSCVRSRRPAGRHRPQRHDRHLHRLAPAEGFVEAVSASKSVFGATGQRAIGSCRARAPSRCPIPRSRPFMRVPRGSASRRIDGRAWTPGPAPLGSRDGESDLARSVNAGDSRVLVGILNSGIDASHPDLAGQLETGLSRNFVTDIPLSTDRARSPRCVIRRPLTTAAMAPMSPERSRQRRMAWASPAWPPE